MRRSPDVTATSGVAPHVSTSRTDTVGGIDLLAAARGQRVSRSLQCAEPDLAGGLDLQQRAPARAAPAAPALR